VAQDWSQDRTRAAMVAVMLDRIASLYEQHHAA
jgi:hypothetical protein